MPAFQRDFRKRALGDIRGARSVARKAMRAVPAYGRFLADHGLDPETLSKDEFDWSTLPITDKKNFCSKYPILDLVPPENRDSLWYFLRSSGTAGVPYFWPYLKGEHLRRLDWEGTLIELFGIDRRRTLAVMGQALGSWASGVLPYVSLHNISVRRPNLSALCIGNRFDEIIDAVGTLHPLYDQVLLFMVPSQIERFLEYVRRRRIPFPYEKTRFAVTAEAFSEDLRMELADLCRTSFPVVPLGCHAFASSDTGVVGQESLPSIALRSLLHLCEALRRALGVPSPVPNLYHAGSVAYLELIDGELVYTQWGGIPLVRYNIRDRGELWDWSAIRRTISEFPVPASLSALRDCVRNAPDLPDLVAYLGRADGIKLRGGMLHFADLEAALHHARLRRWTTGQYTVRPIAAGSGTRRLRWDVELKGGLRPSRRLRDEFYRTLVGEMCRMDPMFAHHYRQTFADWEKKSRPVFDIRLRPWPDLSRKLSEHPKRRVLAAP